MSFKSQVGRRMRLFRRQQRLSIHMLAKKLRLPVGLLRVWEQGAWPVPLNHQLTIARALGVSLEALQLEEDSSSMVSADQAALGAKLKAHRVSAGLSLEEVARELDMAPEFFALVETGERVPPYSSKLDKVLGRFMGEAALGFAEDLAQLTSGGGSSAPNVARARGIPQLLELETPFGAPAVDPYCPHCGVQARLDETGILQAICPHLLFVWIDLVDEFIYETPQFTELNKVWSESVDEDAEHDLHHMSVEGFAARGYDRQLVLLSVTSSGMACGPVSSTLFFGFLASDQ
jgi:transcriptional regulator with XRE-family HTH domain